MGLKERHCRAFFAAWTCAVMVSLCVHVLFVWGLARFQGGREARVDRERGKALVVHLMHQPPRLRSVDHGQLGTEPVKSQPLAYPVGARRQKHGVLSPLVPDEPGESVASNGSVLTRVQDEVRTGSGVSTSRDSQVTEIPGRPDGTLQEWVSNCLLASVGDRLEEMDDLREFGLFPRRYQVRIEASASPPVVDRFVPIEAEGLSYVDSLLQTLLEECLVREPLHSVQGDGDAPSHFETVVTFVWKGAAH